MDFGLEDHQDQLVRSVEQWTGRSWAAGAIDTADGRRALWSEVVANGWAGMLTPGVRPAHGLGRAPDLGPAPGPDTGSAPGSGSAATALSPGAATAADTATTLDAALVVESLARGGCSLPIVGAGLVAPLAAGAAGVEVGAGTLGLVAFEADASSQPSARGLEIADTVVAVRWRHGSPADGGRRWEVAAIPLGPGAELVSLQTEDRFQLNAFADPGVLDGARWQAADAEAMELAWRIGAVLSAAELVGLARSVLDGAVEYARVRVQGGKPIGGHQAVQHRLADMLAAVDGPRYLTYLAAAHMFDDEVAVHQAKALAARDCLTAIRSAHQVLGAISFSAEHELHHFHKQALLAANEFGSANHHWRALEALGGG